MARSLGTIEATVIHLRLQRPDRREYFLWLALELELNSSEVGPVARG
jgi:hypothetical protein